jgi:hypothetical protein
MTGGFRTSEPRIVRTNCYAINRRLRTDPTDYRIALWFPLQRASYKDRNVLRLRTDAKIRRAMHDGLRPLAQ